MNKQKMKKKKQELESNTIIIYFLLLIIFSLLWFAGGYGLGKSYVLNENIEISEQIIDTLEYCQNIISDYENIKVENYKLKEAVKDYNTCESGWNNIVIQSECKSSMYLNGLKALSIPEEFKTASVWFNFKMEYIEEIMAWNKTVEIKDLYPKQQMPLNRAWTQEEITNIYNNGTGRTYIDIQDINFSVWNNITLDSYGKILVNDKILIR
jgi:hypothetical protein